MRFKTRAPKRKPLDALTKANLSPCSTSLYYFLRVVLRLVLQHSAVMTNLNWKWVVIPLAAKLNLLTLLKYAAEKGPHSALLKTASLGSGATHSSRHGTFGKLLIQLAKTDVLKLVNWGMTGLDEHWNCWIGDTTIAEAMLDRVMQRNNRLVLTGDSFRQKPKAQKKEPEKDAS